MCVCVCVCLCVCVRVFVRVCVDVAATTVATVTVATIAATIIATLVVVVLLLSLMLLLSPPLSPLLLLLSPRACVCVLKVRGTNLPPKTAILAVAVISPLSSLSHATPCCLPHRLSPSLRARASTVYLRRNRKINGPRQISTLAVATVNLIAALHLQKLHSSANKQNRSS